MNNSPRALRAIAFAIAVLFPAARIETQARPAASDRLALRGATLIDGTGAAPKLNQTILINRGVIEDIFETPSRKIPAGVRVVDVTGKFVIPGLIDAHVHNATDPFGGDKDARARLQLALLGGLTSVRDMAGDVLALQPLAYDSKPAASDLPRIFYVSLMAGPTFFGDARTKASAHGGTPGDVPWMKAITPATDIKEAVRIAKGTGATAIKIYADLPADLVTKITTEAHKQGMKVWSHSTIFPATPNDAVDAGVDVISHAIYMYWAGIPNPPQHYGDRTPPRSAYDSVPPGGPVMQALFAKMVAQNTIFDATLSILPRFESARGPVSGLVDPKRAAQWSYDVTRAAKLAGVTIDAGTDGMMPNTPDSLPGLHGEMELLVTRAGFTPLEAITAATLNSAKAIGAQATLGTVAVGKMADMVVLSADPSVDIRNTRRISFVVRGGVIHERPKPH